MHACIQAERVGVLECLQALGRALPRNPRGASALSVVETVTGIFHFFILLFFLRGLWCIVPRTRVMYLYSRTRVMYLYSRTRVMYLYSRTRVMYLYSRTRVMYPGVCCPVIVPTLSLSHTHTKHTHTHTHTLTHSHTHTHMHTHMHMCVYVFVCVCVFMCLCVCVRECVCISLPAQPRAWLSSSPRVLTKIWWSL
jgi:hypothetical protein